MSSHTIPLHVITSLGITTNDFERGDYVADALHVRGMGQLASRDVLSYFSQYRPANVEWVDKHNCEYITYLHTIICMFL